MIPLARAGEVHRQRDEDPGDGGSDTIGAACADAVQFSQLGVVGDRGQELAFLAEAQEEFQADQRCHGDTDSPQIPVADRDPADDVHRGDDGREQCLRLGAEQQGQDVDHQFGQDQREDEERQIAGVARAQHIEAPGLDRDPGGSGERCAHRESNKYWQGQVVQDEEHRVERDTHRAGLGEVPQPGDLLRQREGHRQQHVGRGGDCPGPKDLQQDDRIGHPQRS